MQCSVLLVLFGIRKKIT